MASKGFDKSHSARDPWQFHRMKLLPPYVLAEVTRLRHEARRRQEDIIDLGMGNPDMPTPIHIVNKMQESLSRSGTNRYSISRGITGLRKAQMRYYQRRFGVTLDPEEGVVVTIGSKEGIASLAQAITAPGDVVLVPNPTYPIHAYAFMLAGGSLRYLPPRADESFLSAVKRCISECIPKPMGLVLNFPSNPTASTATLDFYREVVAIAKRHEMFIFSDLAYAELYYDIPPPNSVLEIPEARDICVEFTSLSKTYAMPGWRVGFAVGSKKLLSALVRYKSYVDYGSFTPIQVAATAALDGDDVCIKEIRNTYRERRDTLVESFGRSGWHIPKPDATMFAWAPLPVPLRDRGSLWFARKLLEESRIAVSAGVGFGEEGEGYVRISLIENVQRIRQAARNLRPFFQKYLKSV